MLKKILLVLLVLFLLIQLIPRPAKNVSGGLSAQDISTRYTVPPSIDSILKESCNDCHSNNTYYPWYSAIQPLAWWLGDHIQEGKKGINFSEFTGYSLPKQYHKLEEVEEMIESGEMPLKSYSLIHTKSKLNKQQKTALVNWSKAVRAEMEQTYPRDSLVRKK
jgi:hypothetical protein